MINKIQARQKRYIEEIILLLVLVLSLIGMGITDFSPLESHRYWTLMIIVFTFASIALGWAREEYQEKHFKELIARQIIY